MYGNDKFEQIFTHCTLSRGNFFFLSNRANAQNVEKKKAGGVTLVSSGYVFLTLPIARRDRKL